MDSSEIDEKIRLVIGVINSTGKALFWRDENYMQLGNYAIVENKDGYDLIKIIAKVETTKANAKRLTNTEYENIKNTIQEIPNLMEN